MRPWVVTVATVVMLSLTALAAPASATWTATCDTLANTVTFSGSGGLVLSDSGGSLAHDQAGTFTGPTDCDSSTPGTQTVSTPASITVSGTGSPASLDVDWTASSADVSSYVSPGGVSGTPLGNVAASGLSALVVDAGSGANEFNAGAQSGTPVTINGGAGGDNVSVGGPWEGTYGTLAGMTGTLTFNGGGGPNGLKVKDANDTAANSYSYNGSSLIRNGTATITRGDLGTYFELDTDSNDTLEMLDTTSSLTSIVGLGTLSYATLSQNISANLQAGTATGVGSLTGVDRVVGGSGNDALVAKDGFAAALIGGPGNDTLTGGTGADVIEPGTGNDTVDGGGATDKLVYGDRTAPVTIDFVGHTAGDPLSSEADTFQNIEQAVGGSGADTFKSRDGVVQQLDCGGGSDTVFGDVAGQFTSSVTDALTGCETVNPDYSPPASGGGDTTTPTTTAQTPAGDTQAPAATATTTTTAPTTAPVVRCVVPKLKGLTLKKAKTALTKNRCGLGKVVKKRAPKATRGKVIAQKLAPGLKKPVRTPVSLTLGK